MDSLQEILQYHNLSGKAKKKGENMHPRIHSCTVVHMYIKICHDLGRIDFFNFFFKSVLY